MLAVVRAIDAGGFKTPNDMLFVGNVGEEGEGDLRGVKFLLQQGQVQGSHQAVHRHRRREPASITRGGVGSLRYRVTFKGPGGHSYGAFGLVNPAFAMGNAIAKFARLQVPATPKDHLQRRHRQRRHVGQLNPRRGADGVDLRSESCAELKKVNDAFLGVVREAVAEENKARSTREGPITADPALIGDRPCGETLMTTPIVQTATAVIKAFGLTPSVRHQQHRLQRADEPRHPGDHHRPRRSWRPGPRAGRMDRRRAQKRRRGDSDRDRDDCRRREWRIGSGDAIAAVTADPRPVADADHFSIGGN